MQLVVLANRDLKDELMIHGIDAHARIIWIENADDFSKQQGADAYIDLLFDNSANRSTVLKSMGSTVIVNSVIHSVDDSFTRINGWPGFLKRAVAEVSSKTEHEQKKIEEIFSLFNRKTGWVPDQPGFISARVVAMIINEAYFALGEEVSTKEEIDTAMKLGTNYPYGPFEWSEKIGLKNIYDLLTVMSKTNARYNPSPRLEQEVLR